jgi:quercetin dioxygenase-like cupin family protein
MAVLSDRRRGSASVGEVKRWDLTSLTSSTEKRTAREPGPDAPRVPRRERQIPRVLFSAPECRAVALELEPGEEMGDHHVRERAVVSVAAGRVVIDASGEATECGAGTVLTLDPGERHGVRAIEHSLLLLILAPWPAAEHYIDAEAADAAHLPANASIAPDATTGESVGA